MTPHKPHKVAEHPLRRFTRLGGTGNGDVEQTPPVVTPEPSHGLHRTYNRLSDAKILRGIEHTVNKTGQPLQSDRGCTPQFR